MSKTHYLELSNNLHIDDINRAIRSIPNDVKVIELSLHKLKWTFDSQLHQLEHLFASIPRSVTTLNFSRDSWLYNTHTSEYPILNLFFIECYNQRIRVLSQWFSKLPPHITTVRMPTPQRVFNNHSLALLKGSLPHVKTMRMSMSGINSMSQRSINDWIAIFPYAYQYEIFDDEISNRSSEKMRYFHKQFKEAFIRTILALRLVSRASNNTITPELLHHVMQYLNFSECVTVVERPFKDLALTEGSNPISTPWPVKQTFFRLATLSWFFSALSIFLFCCSVNELRKQDTKDVVIGSLMVVLSILFNIISHLVYYGINGGFSWHEKRLLQSSTKTSLSLFLTKSVWIL